jgi:glycosyltransferase involved in cell wall biosynthesis
MAGYSGGLWRTWRALASGGPGVLHVQWAPVPLLDALLLGAARRRGWSIVYTAHNLLPHRTPRPWDPWQYRRLYRRTDAVIVHAAVLADRLVATVGMRREQVHVVPPGGLGVFRETPLGASEARARLGLDRDAPWLLFFGLIRPYKGLADLIHAMPLVRQRFPRVRLLVAGEPMQRLAPLLRLVDRLGLRDAIVLRSGFVPMRDVAVYFCAADLVVLPYVTGSVSAILLTAYDYGRPVVTTAVGGLPELVDDGRTGFVVPPGRPAALADAVCRGLAEPQRLASMGQAARARMERCHAWDDVARQTVEVYRMARGMGGDSRPEGA